MLNGGSMVWGFCVYFVYMIPLETDVLRKHRFQKISTQLEFLYYTNGKKMDQMVRNDIPCNCIPIDGIAFRYAHI